MDMWATIIEKMQGTRSAVLNVPREECEGGRENCRGAERMCWSNAFFGRRAIDSAGEETKRGRETEEFGKSTHGSASRFSFWAALRALQMY